MAKTLTGATGYLYQGEGLLVKAHIVPEGPIVNLNKTPIPDVDVATALWLTVRSASAIAALAGVTMPDGGQTIAILGPSGGLTKFGKALADDAGRNSRFYTTEEFLQKMDPEVAATVYPKVVTNYSTSSTEVKAAA